MRYVIHIALVVLLFSGAILLELYGAMREHESIYGGLVLIVLPGIVTLLLLQKPLFARTAPACSFGFAGILGVVLGGLVYVESTRLIAIHQEKLLKAPLEVERDVLRQLRPSQGGNPAPPVESPLGAESQTSVPLPQGLTPRLASELRSIIARSEQVLARTVREPDQNQSAHRSFVENCRRRINQEAELIVGNEHARDIGLVGLACGGLMIAGGVLFFLRRRKGQRGEEMRPQLDPVSV